MFVLNVWDDKLKREAKAVVLEDDENWDERVDQITDLVYDLGCLVYEYGDSLEIETEQDLLDVECGCWVVVSGPVIEVLTGKDFTNRFTEVI